MPTASTSASAFFRAHSKPSRFGLASSQDVELDVGGMSPAARLPKMSKDDVIAQLKKVDCATV